MLDRYSFVDHYDWKGRLQDEPDDEEPRLRRHCNRCGTFLPKKPETITRMAPLDYQINYDHVGEIVGYTVSKYEQEIEWLWICTKCGKEYDCDEIYQ